MAFRRLFLGMALTCMLLSACAEPAAQRPASAVPASTGDAKAAITVVLDALNDAASKADEPRYFALFSDDAVFLGTDGKERWDLSAFHAFAHPYFAKGKAWSFTSVRRAITFAPPPESGVAWFDEDLATPNLGPCRGSGVVVRQNGAWKIAQYNLTVVIPNERLDEVKALLENGKK